jgi:S-adenosylmethionine:tRNA ribosyltransferase-isomerase
MKIRDFDFPLPAELIAQKPLPRRDGSRMMVVRRAEGSFGHARFADLPEYLRADDLLVLNDVKVIPAKTWGRRGAATIEFLFVKEIEPGTWEALARPARRLRTGERVEFPDGSSAAVITAGDGGMRILRFPDENVRERLGRIGFAPLPPYIKRERADGSKRAEDLDRYQTVFAAGGDAIAAPTAGLHFTPEILAAIGHKGVPTAKLTLNVGLATFQPVRTEDVDVHRMLEESFEISAAAAAAVNGAKARRAPVVAVGTTVVRTLESAGKSGRVDAGRGTTSLFIRPGYEFKIVDRLLTNFHLPKSTLLMLVSAFAGRELILAAYREAVREKYRFFSYGDCMLIL